MIYFWPKLFKQIVKRAISSTAIKPIAYYYAGLGSCLMYHRILDGSFTDNNWDHFISAAIGVPLDSFEQQMQYLAKNYQCLDLDTAIDQINTNKFCRKSIIVTFDDGYKDNLYLALPILEKYNIPATIYISTGLIDRSAHLWWYELDYCLAQLNHLELDFNNQHYHWSLSTQAQKKQARQILENLFFTSSLEKQAELITRLRLPCHKQYNYDDLILTWNEVKQLDAHPLITIGAHTINHPVLHQLTTQQAEKEIMHAKNHLEDVLGHTIKHFSYPYGGREHASTREFGLAKKLGFASAFTTRIGHINQNHRQHLTALPRIYIGYNDTIDNFKFRLSGSHAMLAQRGVRTVTN